MCRQTEDSIYMQQRIFFLVAWIRRVFLDEPFGACWELCHTLCGSKDFFNSYQGTRCTCGPEVCESDSICMELRDEITKMTVEKKSSCGDTKKWNYYKPATWTAQFPVMTSDGAIIWNYLGQTVCPVLKRVSMDEFLYWEKIVLKVLRNL
jgi:hypothetical protein